VKSTKDRNYIKLVMDLNVKLLRLKYNFGKIQGCFVKILTPRFSRINKIIFILEKVEKINYQNIRDLIVKETLF
jgi:hypothetical protein